ncbi:MAG: hypothetical protein RBG13Loki_4226 [Promethearchaeota archaeon CR_4]|nr:MAG: hypothetical protein RBG13Loki_4226 [Candidatus Lokiarchaeota archaeon CR_4]
MQEKINLGTKSKIGTDISNTTTPRRGHRRQMTPVDEAVVIFHRLHREFGERSAPQQRSVPARVIQGMYAILRMKQAQYYAWRENEWPAYYIAFRLRRLIATSVFHRFKNQRRVLYRGQSTWNVRLHCAHDTDQVILGDVCETNAIFNQGGFGFIILEAEATYDVQGTIRKWHDQLKGGPSAYTRCVAAEGRQSSLRKASFSLVKGTAFYFPNLSNFRSGITAGWLNDSFGLNMREPNGQKRPHPKYILSIGNIPRRFRVVEHNFNTILPGDQLKIPKGGEN